MAVHNNPNEVKSDGLLDKNTYYHAKNIQAYPASNSVDTSKLMTELNLRNTTINITDKNYVVSPNPENELDDVTPGYDISFNKDTNLMTIEPGKAIINGFEVVTTESITYRLPTEDEYYKTTTVDDKEYGKKYAHKYANYALLCLHTIFDALDNLSGNVQVGSEWYFEGIHVCYPTAAEYEAHENEYLLLGGVDATGHYIINDEKFDRIDAKYISIRMEPDPETSIPPKQSTDLDEFINNHLHSYWMSKHGDNQYGNLFFRQISKDYLDPKYNYELEPMIYPYTEDYSISISRMFSEDLETETFNAEAGFINVNQVYIPSRDEEHDNIYDKCTVLIKPFGLFFRGPNNIQEDLDPIYHDMLGNKSKVGYTYHYYAYSGYAPQFKNINNDVKKYMTAGYQLTDNNTFLNRITTRCNISDSELYPSSGIFGETFSNKGTVVEQGSFIWDSVGFTNEALDTDEELHPQRFKVQFASNRTTTDYTEKTQDGFFYVGAVDRNKYIQNDLFSIENSIRTTYKSKANNDGDYFSIDISSANQNIKFDTQKQTCTISLRDDENIANETSWKNVLDFKDNIEIQKHTEYLDGNPIPKGGNLWAQGFIVAGNYKDVTYEEDSKTNINKDPSLIEVPDFVHTGNEKRKLQPGDIYATQVWTAVYNDIAEIFDFSDDIIRKEIVGLVVAQDNKNLNKFTIANKHNKNIVGIVSENPAICCGGEDCENGVPVALAGRVKARYEGKKLKPGDFVGLSKKTPGFVSKCSHFSKYRCGKVLRILDDKFIEVLVLL